VPILVARLEVTLWRLWVGSKGYRSEKVFLEGLQSQGYYQFSRVLGAHKPTFPKNINFKSDIFKSVDGSDGIGSNAPIV